LLTPTRTTAELLRRVCHALAPLRDHSIAAGMTLPTVVDLTSLTGPLDADRLRLRWRTGAARAILGHGSGGALEFDLDADGPHLLIAGTTGSGKSELLQTFIASLAANASPQAVTFLLVDYKGGAAFGAITELPHVVGVLTDLDPAGSSRALASLRAELRRRERLEAAGAPRPAKLVVVIDEFATLAAELPEFLAGMLDIAQRGRSLGLHLVVATQRPAGVVSPAMRANISARICLRVSDPAGSLDVISIPDAAALPSGCPGRAIARLGGVTRTFQTARVSVPAPPEVTVIAASERDIPSGAPFFGQWDDGKSESITILRTIIDAARIAASGMPAADRPWLPPLPSRIDAREAAPTTLAVADLPDRQCRDELAAPEASALVLGPPQSGRSTALRRIAALAAARGEELIVIDGADGLADLQDWSAVSTYLTVREPRLVMRVLTLLSDPSRRPRDGHLRHVIIDHLDLVAAELERTDYATGGALLTELLTRAADTVRISGSGPQRLQHQRIAAGFREVLELGTAGTTIPGRGTWSGRAVQLVDAAVGSAATATAPHRDPVVVRPLPASVLCAQLPAPRPAFVPFGVGGDAALPLAADLTGPGGGIVVAGPRRSGVSNTLRVLARQAARGRIPTLWVAADPAAADPNLPGMTIIPCRSSTDALTAALRAHQGPLLLVADHGGIGDDHPAADLFQRFLTVCGPGQHLLVGARTDALMRSRHGHLQAAASFRRGVLLAPDQSHGPLLDLVLPKRSGPVAAGRGVWTWDGTTVPAQIALDATPRQPPGL
jgi:S-DNA-T family DNA segregation ATPase FtsK/SpoIIIE